MTPELVVLHGWGQSRKEWEGFREQMLPQQVTLIDFPGFGDEKLISPDWGVPDYAEWLVKRLSGKSPGSVVLLGHSFGGRVAAHLAHSNPAWLRALVLYGAPLLYRPSLLVRLKVIFAKLLKTFVPLTLRKSMVHSELGEADALGLGSIYRRTVSFDQGITLKDIKVPTLHVWGSKDMEAPLSVAKEAATRIPDSRFEVLPGAGHNAHLEQPLLFYGILSRFLKSF